MVRRVRFDDGKLTVEAFGGHYELVPVDKRRFRLLDGPVDLSLDFEAGPEGRRMKETSPPRPATVWSAIELARPSPAELAPFAGRYYSAELDTTYTVDVKDGALFLRGRRLGGALTPSVRDEFTLGSMVVRFVRDTQGQTSAFLLGQGRVRNLKFARSEAP
jgi:hypothetical protein